MACEERAVASVTADTVLSHEIGSSRGWWLGLSLATNTGQPIAHAQELILKDWRKKVKRWEWSRVSKDRVGSWPGVGMEAPEGKQPWWRKGRRVWLRRVALPYLQFEPLSASLYMYVCAEAYAHPFHMCMHVYIHTHSFKIFATSTIHFLFLNQQSQKLIYLIKNAITQYLRLLFIWQPSNFLTFT